MDTHEPAITLFNVAKEIKLSLETPVILFTKKDYSDKIYKLLLEMRHVLMMEENQQQVLGLVASYHYDWLAAVKEIKAMRQRARDIPREVFLEAVDFTIKCVSNRCNIFKNYVLCVQNTLPISDRSKLNTDIELIDDMQASVIAVLKEKKEFLSNNADATEFILKIELEMEELLNWWDRLNDSLSVLFSESLVDVPLHSELASKLKSIIDELPEVKQKVGYLEKNESGEEFARSMLRVDANHDLEMAKVISKLNVLDERIQRLEDGSSAAVMALQHKRIYLTERLRSLENIRISIQKLQFVISNTTVHSNGDPISLSTINEYHIFNHMLPLDASLRLVTKLVELWETGLQTCHHRKSVITILSAGDIKEEFSDYLGVYSIDKYGRKIYEKADTDDLYQMNERNELVPISDDEKHVFFYDTVGRYYLHNYKRVYKATVTASEYILHPEVGMIKLKETVNGIEYNYDNIGRYYINNEGKRIYVLTDPTVEYENDGFGNLIAVRNTKNSGECAPIGPIVTDSSKYLQKVVGDALRKCLTDVLLHQPPDPILFLANGLEKYRQNMLFKEDHAAEMCEMLQIRQTLKDEEEAHASSKAYSLATHLDEIAYEQSESSF